MIILYLDQPTIPKYFILSIRAFPLINLHYLEEYLKPGWIIFPLRNPRLTKLDRQDQYQEIIDLLHRPLNRLSSKNLPKEYRQVCLIGTGIKTIKLYHQHNVENSLWLKRVPCFKDLKRHSNKLRKQCLRVSNKQLIYYPLIFHWKRNRWRILLAKRKDHCLEMWNSLISLLLQMEFKDLSYERYPIFRIHQTPANLNWASPIQSSSHQTSNHSQNLSKLMTMLRDLWLTISWRNPLILALAFTRIRNKKLHQTQGNMFKETQYPSVPTTSHLLLKFQQWLPEYPILHKLNSTWHQYHQKLQQSKISYQSN